MKIRVSAVQYKLENIKSFEEFAKQCEHYVRTALEFGAEFVLFPEFLQHSFYPWEMKITL